MLVVADSSALIALAICDGLDILPAVYNDVRVPRAVYEEVVVSEKLQASTLKSFLADRIIDVDITHWILAVDGLGRGEIEAMALYKQLSAEMLLIDDRRARAIAEHNRIHCIGVLGFLLFAKQRGKVEKITPYIAKLRASSLYYGEALFTTVLKLASEL